MNTLVPATHPAPAVPPAVRSQSAVAAPVAADLEEAERIFHATLAAYRSPVAPLVHHLRHYRGKRLRPTLLLLTAKACGRVTPAHHALAAAVEMIHTATLVHDDVLDEADVRRHAPTVKAAWGNKTSILLGDMLFTHAFHLTSTVDGRACQIIGDATNRVCAGELRQVCERGNLRLTEADYFSIVDGKTAALTECCGRLGALYAGWSEASADRLAGFGRDLGIAFQIADDLLDLLGDESTAGKTLGTDLREQKLTLPVIHCLGRLPSADADALREAIRLGGDGLGRRVLSALERTHSLAYARKRADEYVRSARRGLDELPRGECRALLEQLTEWAVRRDK